MDDVQVAAQAAVAGGFVLWSVGFWFLMCVAAIFFVLAVSRDSEFWCVVVFGATLLALRAIVGLHYPDWAPHSVGAWIGTAICYLTIGVVWSMYEFYVEYKKQILRLWANIGYDDKGKVEGMSPAQLAEFRDKYIDKHAPKAKAMKGRITAWIVDWPVSMLIYLLSDLLHDLLERIYDIFAGVYDSIAEHVKEKVKRQLSK